MFCPQCGTQNEAKQSYCRQCGQLLATIHLALEGRADEAITKFKQARNSLNYGLTFPGIFILIGLLTFLLGGVVPYAVLAIGFVVCLPSILKAIMLLRMWATCWMYQRVLVARLLSGPSEQPFNRQQSAPLITWIQSRKFQIL